VDLGLLVPATLNSKLSMANEHRSLPYMRCTQLVRQHPQTLWWAIVMPSPEAYHPNIDNDESRAALARQYDLAVY